MNSMIRYFFAGLFCFCVAFSGLSVGEAKEVSVKSDLQNYFKAIKKLDNVYPKELQLSLAKTKDTQMAPSERKKILDTEVIPQLDRLLIAWTKISPATPELEEVHDIYLLAYETLREGMALRSEAWGIEQIEKNMLTVGNTTQALEYQKKADEAHKLASNTLNTSSLDAEDAMLLLVELAQRENVKIPPLYLISPSSGSQATNSYKL